MQYASDYVGVLVAKDGAGLLLGGMLHIFRSCDIK